MAQTNQPVSLLTRKWLHFLVITKPAATSFLLLCRGRILRAALLGLAQPQQVIFGLGDGPLDIDTDPEAGSIPGDTVPLPPSWLDALADIDGSVTAAAGSATDAAGSAAEAAGSAANAAGSATAAGEARDAAEGFRDQTEQEIVPSSAAWSGTVDLTALADAPRLLIAPVSGNVTLQLPDPAGQGRAYTVSLLLLQQPGTAGATVSFSGSTVFTPYGAPVTLTDRGSAYDMLHLIAIGTAWIAVVGGPDLRPLP